MVGPPVDSCDDTLNTIQTLHPVNYPVFLSFGYQPAQFQSVHLANTSIQLDLPNVTEYTKTMTDLTSHQIEQGLDLDKLSNAITTARRTYEISNIGSPPFTPLGSNKHSMGAFVVIVIIILIIIIVAVVYLLYKAKGKASSGLTKAALAAQAAPLTQSYMIPHPDQDKPTPLPPQKETVHIAMMSIGQLALIMFAVIVGAILLIIILKRVYKFLKTAKKCWVVPLDQSEYLTRLTLVISNGKDLIALHLHTVQYPADIISGWEKPKLTDYTIQQITCKHWSSPRLDLEWDGPLTFKVNDEHTTMHLPTELYVPFWKRRTMNNLLETGLMGTNYCEIIIQGEDRVDNPSPSVTDDESPTSYNLITTSEPSKEQKVVISTAPSETVARPPPYPDLATSDYDDVITTQPQAQEPFSELHVHNPSITLSRKPTRSSIKRVNSKVRKSGHQFAITTYPLRWY